MSESKKLVNNFLIKSEVLNNIFEYFEESNEKGGALLFDKITDCLFHFVPLTNISDNPKDEFIFSFDELNARISKYNNDDSVDFIGIIHSHRYSTKPSKEDIMFFTNLVKENDYEYLLFPIYCHKATPKIKWWMMRNKSIEEIDIVVVD